ncbi:MAG: MFS transporter [Anaerolineae bacterium]
MESQVQASTNWKPSFFSLWGAQALSLLGSRIAGFALIWWLTQTTGSATVLAMATLISMLPQIFLSPIAGALVDRLSRRWVMVAADGAVALVSLWLGYLFWAGAMQPWHVVVIMVGREIGGCFHFPAMQASTSLMVPKEQLARVSGMNQLLQGLMAVICPPLGALLLTVLPLHGIMGVDVATAALAIMPLLFIAVPQPAVAADAPRGDVWQDLRAGLRYVAGWPGLCLVGVIATLINLLLMPAFSLTPILVTKHFGGQAPQLAGLESALGIGMIAGGLTLSAWGGFRRRVYTSLVGLAGMGSALVLVGVAPANLLPSAVAGMFLCGFCMPLVNGPLFAAIQATVAPEMQGRVFTLLMSASSAAAPLGLAVAGPVADGAGVGVWFLASGIVCITLAAVSLFLPALMQLEDNNRTAAP